MDFHCPNLLWLFLLCVDDDVFCGCNWLGGERVEEEEEKFEKLKILFSLSLSLRWGGISCFSVRLFLLFATYSDRMSRLGERENERTQQLSPPQREKHENAALSRPYGFAHILHVRFLGVEGCRQQTDSERERAREKRRERAGNGKFKLNKEWEKSNENAEARNFLFLTQFSWLKYELTVDEESLSIRWN